MELKHTATREGRLSSFLKEEMKMSTGLMNRLKWQDKICVNGISQHTDYTVKPGDVITVQLDEPVPEYPAEHEVVTVLYEDDHLLAVDKPAGMLIHPSRARLTGTLANRVVGYYQRTGQNCAFHPITRLDRDTFGMVLVAKNSHIHAAFTQLQAQGKLCKTYHALVYGAPEADSGIIDAPIARKELPSLLREIRPDGKPSLTEYRVLERCGAYSRLFLRPLTGRTHQLRLHCTYAGWPILGDPQYSTPQSAAWSEKYYLQSQLLCAKELEFPHPITGEVMHLRSEMEPQLLTKMKEL